MIEIWGGELRQHGVSPPPAPVVTRHDGSGRREYSIIAVGVQGGRTAASPVVESLGRATLAWDSVNGADAYIVVRDGDEIAGPLRLEGSRKEWSDQPESP